VVTRRRRTVSDPTDENFQWPSPDEIRPVDAGRLMDDIERESMAANKRAKMLTARKAQAKALVDAVLEINELDALPFTTSQGKRVTYTPYEFDAFTVDDYEAFEAWAETQHENYFDNSPKLREGIFRDEMRRRVADGEPLPPGVRRYSEQRLSRSARKS
jgi:hypothetical protein